MRNTLIQIIRVILIGVFITAAALKLYDRTDFIFQLGQLNLFTYDQAQFISWSVPSAELLIALLLVLFPKKGAIGAAIMLTLFTVTLLYAQPENGCGCFGTALHFELWEAVVRNGVLLIGSISLIIKYHTASRTSHGAYFTKHTVSK